MHTKTVFIYIIAKTLESRQIKTKSNPRGRNGCTLNYYNGNIFLFGGLQRHNKMWMYEIDTNTWYAITYADDDENIHIPKCFIHHRSCIYNEYIVINGGLTVNNPTWSAMNDIYLFNMKSKLWKYINCIDMNTKPDHRYGQAMIIHNNYLIIHGGKNNSGNILNDAYTININDVIHNIPSKWIKIELDIGYLSAHIMFTYEYNLLCFAGKKKKDRSNELMKTYELSRIIDTFITKTPQLSSSINRFINAILNGIPLHIPIEIRMVIQQFYGLIKEIQPINMIPMRGGHNGCVMTLNGKYGLFIFGGREAKHGCYNDSYFIQH